VSIDPALVAARLRRLDAGARAAVLADCRRARGETVERNGATVRVERGGEAVTFATREGASADHVVDAAALRDLLCYGLDRRDADRIAARHLGAPLAALRPPLARRAVARASALATPVAVLVVVVAVAGVVVGGVAGGPDGPATEDEPLATPTAAATATPTPTATVPITPIGGPVAPEVSQVPGLGFGGVTDLQRLASAHNRTRPDSYVARARLVRVASDYDVVTRTVTLRVDGDRYRADVRADRDGYETHRATVYGDGDERWAGTQRGEEFSVQRLAANETGPAGVDPAILGPSGVRAALATPETNVTGPTEYEGWPAYRVVGTGVPPNQTDAVETYRVTAYVRPDGFVYAMVVEYTLLGPRLSDRRLEWRYIRAGATVETPSWHPDSGGD
jgi:hypothetical protein